MCRTHKYWSNKEEQTLVNQHYGSLTMKQRQDLAWTMGRTLSSLQARWNFIKSKKVIKPIEAPKPIIVNSAIIDAIVGKATSAAIQLDKNQVTFYF